MGECAAKSIVRHTDQTVPVRGELRLFRMGFIAIKHLRDRLALIGCERCDIDERLDSLIAYPCNDSASVRVTGENNRAIGAFEDVSQRRNVVGKRGQRNRSANNPETLAFERENHVPPAGAIGPRSMNENDSGVLGGSFHHDAVLSLWSRAIPFALRNSPIAEEISTTCVSSAKCPVSRS